MGRKQRKKLIMAVAVLVSAWGYQTFSVQADDGQSSIFSASANLPKNQLPNGHSYFDLKLHPHQKQTISVTVVNDGDTPIKVQSEIRDAYTTDNGAIAYETPNSHLNHATRYRVSQLTKLKSAKIVTIPAQSSKKVQAKITLPKRGNQRGVMLGGWYLTQVDQATKSTGDVNNQYSYLIGLKYTVGKAVKPKLSLHKVAFDKQQQPQKLLLQLANKKAALVSDLTYDVKVYQAHGQKALLHQTVPAGSFAPMSQFNLTVPVDGRMFKSGKYLAKVTAKNKHQKWQLDKQFTVTKTGHIKVKK